MNSGTPGDPLPDPTSTSIPDICRLLTDPDWIHDQSAHKARPPRDVRLIALIPMFYFSRI